MPRPSLASAHAAAPVATAPRFPCFDGFRAIAALAIVGVHATFITGFSFRQRRLIGRFTPQLDIGVAVFFLISGFLLYWPFVGAHLSGRPGPGLGAYARRRLLRIVPAYWVALTVIAFTRHDAQIRSIKEGVIYYGFLQIYFSKYLAHGITAAWSLCTEITFYLFLPFWAVAMRSLVSRLGGSRSRTVRIELAGVAVLYCTGLAVRVAIALVAGQSHPIAVAFFWLPAQMDLFALGMGLAVLSAWAAQHPAGTRAETSAGRAVDVAGRRPWMWWAGAAVLFWTVAQLNLPVDPTLPLSTLQWLAREVLYGLFALCVLLPGIFGPQDRGVIRKLLRNRIVQYLGLISYGIYVWHQALLTEFRRQFQVASFSGHFLATLVFTLLGTIAVATASYALVERPALRLKGRRS